ncbi:MAG: hypothetical protein ACK5MV_10500 [Aminipila sp.]
MKVDLDKLTEKILYCNYNYETFAEKLGLEVDVLYEKINPNGAPLLVKELYKIVELLNLTTIEIKDIFFKY